MLLKQFGGKITKKNLQRYKKSPNWQKGCFQNLVETFMDFKLKRMPDFIYRQIFEGKIRQPNQPLPIIPFDKKIFLNDALAPGKAKFIWYGHSVLLFRIHQKTILLDPMLGPDSSPITPFNTPRFSENTLDLIDAFPKIDLMLITHDHYDHLDLASIQKLKTKTKKYFVGLGVKRHLVAWGVDADRITEFDWWDENIFNNIKITYTPTRHFSGRGPFSRDKSLWGGWSICTPTEKIWFSGDGGYDDHFKTVGEKLGPFDFGFMECGQYNENWPMTHMFPEESVQAALDAGVQKAMPVHWAGFALAQHSWTEPVERFLAAAGAVDLEVVFPKMGRICYIDTKGDGAWFDKDFAK